MTDLCRRVGDMNCGQGRATFKSAIADAYHRVRDVDFSQGRANTEGIIADACHGVGDLNFDQGSATTESTIANAVHRVWDPDFDQRSAVLESCIEDTRYRIRDGCHVRPMISCPNLFCAQNDVLALASDKLQHAFLLQVQLGHKCIIRKYIAAGKQIPEGRRIRWHKVLQDIAYGLMVLHLQIRAGPIKTTNGQAPHGHSKDYRNPKSVTRYA
mmetsp:Transcript_54797/g.122573  ORF Transcript_54797/g.122573 Transcript_54797/m.122573 type:complete len:213 (-) Transcript_54797:10-648(-)